LNDSPTSCEMCIYGKHSLLSTEKLKKLFLNGPILMRL
jgi:hypothetical protein